MHSSSCFPAFICIQRTCPCQFSYPFWHTKKDTCPNMPVSLLHISNITHPYSVEVIEISSVFTSFPYIIWKQWQPADLVKLSDFEHLSIKNQNRRIQKACHLFHMKLIYLAKRLKFSTSTNSPDVDNTQLPHDLWQGTYLPALQ